MDFKAFGPAAVHDSHVADVTCAADRCVVTLNPVDGSAIEVEFEGVRLVTQVDPIGMMLYSINQVLSESGSRTFIFVNWDDNDERRLEVSADVARWRTVGQASWQTV